MTARVKGLKPLQTLSEIVVHVLKGRGYRPILQAGDLKTSTNQRNGFSRFAVNGQLESVNKLKGISMSIIGTIIIGLVAGALAKFVMPGKQGGGWVMTMLLGIAGSVVATYLGQALGLYHQGERTSFIGSTIGAVLLLTAYNLFRKKPQ